jgi:transposase
VFGVHGVDARGKSLVHKRVSRKHLLGLLAKLEPCLVGMEACGSAHHWAREIEKLGHTVKLMSPQFVAPYRKGNKNDPNDAEAICEAVTRPSMRFVPIKSEAQQVCLPKTLSGMTHGRAYGNEAADGRVSEPAAACYPIAVHAACAA